MDIKTQDRNGHIRTTIHLENGERLKLCRCQKSAEYPFCDGTHKTLDNNIGPAVVFAPGAKDPEENQQN